MDEDPKRGCFGCIGCLGVIVLLFILTPWGRSFWGALWFVGIVVIGAFTLLIKSLKDGDSQEKEQDTETELIRSIYLVPSFSRNK